MLESLRKLQSELSELRKEITALSTPTIAKKSIREKAEALGARWFSDFSERLFSEYGFEPDLIGFYSDHFGRLIKISAPNNRKKSYIDTLRSILISFRDDLIIPIQTNPKGLANASLLTKFLEDITVPEENEYMKESINCARHKYYRAAVVLAWCAAIDRIHRVVEKEGLGRFNITSSVMASQTKGRFKRFNAVQNVSSFNDLREVFDTVVLWILEGMNLIDGNQHTRLRSCFDLRCQCAHPGDAPVTEYNLLAYFSDLNEIIFKNPSFLMR